MAEFEVVYEEKIIQQMGEVLGYLCNTDSPYAPASLDLGNTPARWVKMIRELTTPAEFNFTTFPSDHDEMIVCSPIPLYSLCSHHVIPFIGTAHVAYLPQGRIAGLSKLARTVQYSMKGLWTQEDLCAEIHTYLTHHLQPMGVAVVIRAEHLCMTMRGAQSMGTRTTTSKMSGPFLDPEKQARQEFLELIR